MTSNIKVLYILILKFLEMVTKLICIINKKMLEFVPSEARKTFKCTFVSYK